MRRSRSRESRCARPFRAGEYIRRNLTKLALAGGVGLVGLIGLWEYKRNNQIQVDWPTMLEDAGERYCQQIACHRLAKRQTTPVYVLSTDEFLDARIADSGGLTDEQKQDIAQRVVEEVSKDGTTVRINESLLTDYANWAIANRPDAVEAVQPHRFVDVFTESILFHAFTHLNQPPERAIEPVTIEDLTGPMTFDRFDGFTLVGKSDDNRVVRLTGFNEAVTESVARRIRTRAGTYIGSNPQYSMGADLVDEINARAGISLDEFEDYVSGQLPTDQLLDRWGALRRNTAQSPQRAAIRAAIPLGFLTTGELPAVEATQRIHSILNLAMPTPTPQN